MKMAGVGGDTPFTVLEGDLTIADQRVASKQIHLDSSVGIVDLRGSLGLDSTLDYQGTVTVNPAAALGTGKVGSVVGGLIGSRVGKITVPFALAGTIESPKVTPGKGVPSFGAPSTASGSAPSAAPSAPAALRARRREHAEKFVQEKELNVSSVATGFSLSGFARMQGHRFTG